jgi:hypothetical protein
MNWSNNVDKNCDSFSCVDYPGSSFKSCRRDYRGRRPRWVYLLNGSMYEHTCKEFMTLSFCCFLSLRRVGFKIFAAVNNLVEVFWVMTPSSVAAWYQCFGGPVLPPSSGYPFATLQGVTTQKTSTWILFTAVKTSNIVIISNFHRMNFQNRENCYEATPPLSSPNLQLVTRERWFMLIDCLPNFGNIR